MLGFVGGWSGYDRWGCCTSARVKRDACCSRNKAAVVFMGRRSEKIATRKGKQEQVRVKLFSRVGKQILSAVREGGGTNPDTNKALALAFDAAARVNFPKDNIQRLLARASSRDQADFKRALFEVYAHGGVGVLIDVFSDNNGRAMSDIRTVLNRFSVSLADSGSVSFNFDRRGFLSIPKLPLTMTADDLLLTAVDAGALECEPLETDDDGAESAGFEILTEPGELMQVRTGLEEQGVVTESASFVMVPKMRVEVGDEDEENIVKLVEALEELEDVDAVFHNMQ